MLETVNSKEHDASVVLYAKKILKTKLAYSFDPFIFDGSSKAEKTETGMYKRDFCFQI